MSHQVAKLILEQAGTFVERTEAVKSAMQLGMPLGEIEDYLDWLEMVRNGCPQQPGESTTLSDESDPSEE